MELLEINIHQLWVLIIKHNRTTDDYELMHKIGKGKFSEVFEGFNILTDQKVIIKMLKPTK